MFEGVLTQSILARAQKENLIKINFVNPRDFAKDKHKSVDDKPYGGGAGMIIRADVIVSALESISPKPYSVLLSASGKRYEQKKARKFANEKNLAIICGHYEGVDARVEKYVDEVVSIGDFVLTGGEIAAAAIIDSVTRLIPGVISPESLESESFSPTTRNQLPDTSYLEHPQYTRPENFRGVKVPKVLLSGNHKKISEWRIKRSKKSN